MLTNRRMIVHLDGKESRWRKSNNGLPEGSVLAPLLFNLYGHDMPKTKCNRFQYADDTALACQDKDISNFEKRLEEDLETLKLYFKKWRLKLNPQKIESIIYHLNNRQASTTMNITFDGRGTAQTYTKISWYYSRPIFNIQATHRKVSTKNQNKE